MTTDRMYKGQLISECTCGKRERGGKWIIQTYHHSGNPWGDEECPHYYSLANAKAAIDESILYTAD